MTRTEMFVTNYDGCQLRISANLRTTSDQLVVFMHGLGCAKESFDAAFDMPGLDDFSICAFDFPGHGASSRAGLPLYSLQSYADVANILIDHLSPSHVSLVCHSMGGAVGLLVTQSRSDVVTFINIEGNLVAEDCGIVSRATAGQPLDTFIHRSFHEFLRTLRSSDRPDLRAWSDWYANADPAALHEAARSLVEWSDSGKLLDLFRSLPRKAYVHGEYDPKPHLATILVDVPTYSVPSSDHFVMQDNPHDFYTLVAELLDQRKHSLVPTSPRIWASRAH